MASLMGIYQKGNKSLGKQDFYVLEKSEKNRENYKDYSKIPTVAS